MTYELAMRVLADLTSADEDIAEAKQRLAGGNVHDFTRLSTDDLLQYERLCAILVGEMPPTIVLDTAGREMHYHCSRCKEFSDEDLADLREWMTAPEEDEHENQTPEEK